MVNNKLGMAVMINNIIRINNEYIEACSKLYIKVFNDAPWNDKWTLDTAYRRLNDIYCSKF